MNENRTDEASPCACACGVGDGRLRLEEGNRCLEWLAASEWRRVCVVCIASRRRLYYGEVAAGLRAWELDPTVIGTNGTAALNRGTLLQHTIDRTKERKRGERNRRW